MKRKPLHENDELAVKGAKRFVSDLDHAENTQSGENNGDLLLTQNIINISYLLLS